MRSEREKCGHPHKRLSDSMLKESMLVRKGKNLGLAMDLDS